MLVDGKQKIPHQLALFVHQHLFISPLLFVSPEIAWKPPISKTTILRVYHAFSLYISQLSMHYSDIRLHENA